MTGLCDYCRAGAMYQVRVYQRRGWLGRLLRMPPRRAATRDVCSTHREDLA